MVEASKHKDKGIIYLTVYLGKSNKYNCPQNQENFKTIEKLAKIYNFKIKPISSSYEIKNELIFCVEGCGVEDHHIQNKNKVCSITYMTDYSSSFTKYIDKVDHVIFPSLKFAEIYNCLSPKNLYLGSPKYEYCFDKEKNKIAKKYGIDDLESFVLYIAPRNRDSSKVDQIKIVKKIKSMGYTVFCKSRRKDMILNAGIFDKVLYDDDWYPHSTMELIKISNFIINFDSTSIKEAILLYTPILNFSVKPVDRKRLNFLYEYDFCHNINDKVTDEISTAIESIKNIDYTNEFNKCIDNNLFKTKGTCKRILDKVL